MTMRFRNIITAALMAVSTTASALTEREFTVTSPEAGITLGGTLTLPSSGTPRAALVLATGSGAQNRDEEVFGFKPFKVIAERLAAEGYAVLRLDDRGVGQSTGDPAKATLDDYVADLTAALSALDSCLTPQLPKGVLGHSEGGSAAIKIAAAGTPSCRFIVTLAAPAWAGDSIIMSQARAMSVAMSGKWDGEETQRQILDMVKSPLPTAILRSTLTMKLTEMVGDAARLPQVQAQLNQQLDALCSPGYRQLVRYNPAADITSVSTPWLAMNGDKDMQVLEGNLATIAELNPKATICTMPGHNHLFQQGAMTGHIVEYAKLAPPVSEATLQRIIDWLKEIGL